MFSKLLKWNTGRQYSTAGQTIEAMFVPVQLDDNGDQVGSIDFNDETRGISGAFHNVAFTNREITDDVFRTRVIDLYDRGGYENSSVYSSYADRCHFCDRGTQGNFTDDEGEVCDYCESIHGEDSI